MIIPLRTDSPLRRTPYVNWALVAANVAVFLVTNSNPHYSDIGALSTAEPQLYQFFTYQFLHDGYLHILGNMVFLYVFGNNINDRLGNIGYLAFYLAGGVFAGIAYVITADAESVPVVGASGSIAAVTGAYLVLLPRSNIYVFVIYFFGVVEIASLWFIGGFFAFDVYHTLNAPDGVAHMAHIGGTFYGLAICIILLLLRLLPRDPFDIVSMFQRWNRRRQYRDMIASGYNPFEYSQPTAEGQFGKPNAAPPDARTARILEFRAAISSLLLEHNLDAAVKVYLDLKQLDPQGALPRQQQLDIANYLANHQQYAQAAEAYESFLRTYAKSDKVAEVELMIGLIYARYLNQPKRARDYLTLAASKYHAGRELDLAREELARLP